MTGQTYSENLPVTPTAYQSTRSGFLGDAFLAKLNPAGNVLLYSTYLGGSATDRGAGVAVDLLGMAYITGDAQSPDFPTTPGAFQSVDPGGSTTAFVAKFDTTQAGLFSLVYSTYLGGSLLSGGVCCGADLAFAIAVDPDGNAYVTGRTNLPDFPTTPNAAQPSLANNSGDAFVSKLNASGSALLYSTYLGGGTSADEGRGIAIDGTGNAYVTGIAGSDFPTTPGALQSTYQGDGDAFVTKVDTVNGPLVYSTYLGGGARDEGRAIAVNSSGNAFVTGIANFILGFPGFSGSGAAPVFVTKMNTTGTAVEYSEFIGATEGNGIALNAEEVYVTGTVNPDSGVPTTPDAFQTSPAGNSDAFLVKFGPTCAPPPAGMVVWYPGDGNGDDIQGPTFENGTLQNDATFTAGKVAQAFSFDGIDDRVQIGNPSNLQLQDLTIDMWFKRGSATIVSNNPNPFHTGNIFCYGTNGYAFYINSDTNHLGFGKVDVSGVNGTIAIADTSYHHIAVTKSGNQVTFYVDGVQDGPFTYNETFSFATDVAIGSCGDARTVGSFFGSVDELEVFNRPLTATEIQAIYNAGSAGKCKPPVQLTAAVSRKTHGKGGPTFDIALPLTGPTLGIECRSGGASNSHHVVFTFASPVTFSDATVTPGPGGTASLENPHTTTSPDGTEVTVNLTGVSDAQTITVTLLDVSNGASTTSFQVPMGVLLGDTSENRTVNSSDVSQTKSESGQAASASNFRSNVTVSGTINSSDVSLVKSKSGTGLPQQTDSRPTSFSK